MLANCFWLKIGLDRKVFKLPILATGSEPLNATDKNGGSALTWKLSACMLS